MASSSSKIPVAHKSLEKPIKCFCIIAHLHFLGPSVITQAGSFTTTSLKISAQGGANCVTVRVGMNGSIEKLHIIVTYMYCHECSHTDQYNRFLYVMLCIVLLAAENGEFLTSDLKGVRSTLS